MNPLTRWRRTLGVAASVAFALAGLAAPLSPASADETPPATGWYLSLGDSLAAGERELHIANLTEGFAQHVLAAVRSGADPKAKLVNLGCSGGETTGSFMSGGVCSYEEGSQLAQAEQFLHAHARHTRLVTISLGANNVQRCVRNGQIDLPCIQSGMTQVAHDLPAIYSRIRAVAPDVEIVVTNYYNAFLAAWLTGPSGQVLAQTSSVLQDQLNGIIEANAAAVGADVADVATAFQSDNWSPYGSTGIPTNVVVICQTTYMCSHTNFHANPTGYALIAQAIVARLG
jgi:lysophospholipase L1-like esterase